MKYNEIPSYLEMKREILSIQMRHQSVQVDTIGYSEDLRPIYSLQIGNGTKTLIFLAGVHARETINPAVLIRLAEDAAMYEENTSSEKNVLFSKFRFVFVPLLNPDGYEICRAGFPMIRNAKLRGTALINTYPKETGKNILWKENARGIDLNRNFPAVSYLPEKSGDYAGSESETRAFIQLVKKSQNAGLVDFHSRGEVIYYYRRAMSKSYNDRQLYLAELISKASGYRIGTPEDEFGQDMRGGNSVHFYSEYTKEPALSVETVPEFAEFPLESKWIAVVYEQIKEIPYVFANGLLK